MAHVAFVGRIETARRRGIAVELSFEAALYASRALGLAPYGDGRIMILPPNREACHRVFPDLQFQFP